MKITYRGGYDKTSQESIDQSTLVAYSKKVQYLVRKGGKIAVVTFAKDDGYYDEMIRENFGSEVDIINHSSLAPNWNSYNEIYLLGGETIRLKEALLKSAFSPSSLKANVHLIGDSAGAMVLSAHFYDIATDGSIEFYDGLCPQSNHITIVHANNPRYSPKNLFTKIESFAQDHNIKVIQLNENEELTK